VKHGEVQYRAFISYSHADKACAEWLHRALESYRIPSKLVGDETPLGVVPARLGRVFKDRDELPAAGNLSTELQAALKASMFLIVIASPSAAKSRWVNEEVLQFKMMHGHRKGGGTARVLALIADGEPGDAGDGACFPPALRYHVARDGTITDEMAEPIAVDIRSGGDGRKLAKLKLVAGLTGLPLDSLVQREAARRQRTMGLLAGASMVLTAIMAVLTVLAIQGRREAERQRAQADGLIEYMLTDLRQKLEPVGRLEVMDSVGQRALAYYAAQNLGRLSPDELGRRARALHLVGEVRDLRGDSEGALKAFREAERTTAEQLARDPESPDRMFDHAQSVFWVGQTAWARKDWPTTEASFRRYVELADAMAATDPKNPKWQMEQGYAANGLGAFFLQVDRPREAVAQFKRYVVTAQALAARSSADRVRQTDLGQARAWLADAYAESGNFADARAQREAELAIYAVLLAADARNAEVRNMMARAHDALGEIYLFEGDFASAAARGAVADEIFRDLIQADPENQLVREMAVSASLRHAEALLFAGRPVEAAAQGRFALDGAADLVRSDPARTGWRTGQLMWARGLQVATAFALGERAEARAELARFRTEFQPLRSADIAAGQGRGWVMIHALEALERAGAGDLQAARTHAEEARAAAGSALDHREVALLDALSKRIPAVPPPGSGPASAWPAELLLAPASRR